MTDYPIDPELQPWVAMLPEINLADIVASRDQAGELVSQLPPVQVPDSIQIREVAIPGRDGAPDVRARIYAPVEPRVRRARVVQIHGGGFMMGDHRDDGRLVPAHRGGARRRRGRRRRVPPRARAPVPGRHRGLLCGARVDRATRRASSASTRRASRRRPERRRRPRGRHRAARARPRRPGALLPAARDPRARRPPRHAVDARFNDTPLWNRPNAVWSWKHYLGPEPRRRGVAVRGARARRGPRRAAAGLRVDDGVRSAARRRHPLRAAAAPGRRPVELHSYPGTFHGSSMVQGAAITRRMEADKLDALRRALG